MSILKMPVLFGRLHVNLGVLTNPHFTQMLQQFLNTLYLVFNERSLLLEINSAVSQSGISSGIV